MRKLYLILFILCISVTGFTKTSQELTNNFLSKCSQFKSRQEAFSSFTKLTKNLERNYKDIKTQEIAHKLAEEKKEAKIIKILIPYIIPEAIPGNDQYKVCWRLLKEAQHSDSPINVLKHWKKCATSITSETDDFISQIYICLESSKENKN